MAFWDITPTTSGQEHFLPYSTLDMGTVAVHDEQSRFELAPCCIIIYFVGSFLLLYLFC